MLIKNSINKINVIVSDRVNKQIDLLCNKIHDVEWSGILVYGISGKMSEREKFHIVLEDIIPMNKGTHTYTSFSFNETKRDISGTDDFMIDYFNIYSEKLCNEYRIGLIHSHNNFTTFFSGTDISELHINVHNHDFYLSFITNNNREDIAKLSFSGKANINSNITHHFTDTDQTEFIVSDNNTTTDVSVMDFDCNIIYESDTNYNVTNDSFFIEKLDSIISKAEVKNIVLQTDNKLFNKYNRYVINTIEDDVEDDIEDTDYIGIIRNKLLSRTSVLTMDERLYLIELLDNADQLMF